MLYFHAKYNINLFSEEKVCLRSIQTAIDKVCVGYYEKAQ